MIDLTIGNIYTMSIRGNTVQMKLVSAEMSDSGTYILGLKDMSSSKTLNESKLDISEVEYTTHGLTGKATKE